MGVTSLGRHTRPACHQGSTRFNKTMSRMQIQLLCACVLYSMGHVNFYAHIWAFVTSISHMGEILDADWSRQNLLRSDWLVLLGATITTHAKFAILIAFH